MSESPYASPESDLSQAENTGPEQTTMKEILFSFKGRTGRSGYWLSMLVLIVLSLVWIALLAAVAPAEGEDSPAFLLILPMAIISMWISLAAQIKRWHDRGKSGWWILIGIIPLIGPIWALIENGMLAGDPSVNAYGAPKKL